MRDPGERFEATVWVRRRLRFERLLDDLAETAAADVRERRRPA